LFFAEQADGSLEPVSAFERTKVIEIKEEDWVPSTSIEGQYLYDSIYEIFSAKARGQRILFEEAEKRLKADQVGITTYVHSRGFKAFYAILVPVEREGKFVWLMKLTNKEKKEQHLMDIPGERPPIREAPKLQVLPPVPVLVAAAKRKRK